MPGIARQFEPQITRSGGTPSKFRFTVRCSQCASAEVYDSNKSVAPERIKGYFSERGWLLGRDSSYDLCPSCLTRPQGAPETKLSSQVRHNSVSADQRRRETADILARHLGKPEALAAEVFRPKDAPPSLAATSASAPQPMPAPVLPDAVERALTGMAADLKGLRSAVEIIAEQVSQLVALGSQQVDAIARLAPALAHSDEDLSTSLRQAASAVQTVSRSSQVRIDQPPSEDTVGCSERLASTAATSAPERVKETAESARKNSASRRAGTKSGLGSSSTVAVKSIPDAKRTDRFYTSIRLPRELWDRAEFGPDDRVLLAWSGKALIIERAVEGGVKPKVMSETSVVLQSWKLGNLNFDPQKVAGSNGTLRLTAGRSNGV